jgi:hypothetical protein
MSSEDPTNGTKKKTTTNGNGNGSSSILSRLEQELETLSLESTNVHTERDKQRKELELLQNDNDVLQQQKEQRGLRKQLFADLHDVQTTVDKKRKQQRQQQEDLEQTKTHHRQLKRTFDLLQGGVQEILEKSAQDTPRTDKAKQLALQRQEALKALVASGSFRMFHMRAAFQATSTNEDEDDEINDDNHHHNHHHNNSDIRLYASKKRSARLDSIESMISTISDTHSKQKSILDADDTTPPSTRRQPHRATTGTTRSSRSCSSRRSNKSRSNRSRSSRSLSRGRRKHKAGTRTSTFASQEPKKTSLMNMLDEHEHDDDDNSEGTPRTCNTETR